MGDTTHDADPAKPEEATSPEETTEAKPDAAPTTPDTAPESD